MGQSAFPIHHERSRLACALVLYFLWALATWLLEGRIRTLLRPDAVAERLAYAFVANLLLGLGGGLLLIRRARREGTDPAYDGFPAFPRSLAAVALGLGLGSVFYMVQGEAGIDPIILVNAFAQVFVVSTAEVLVCWSAIGSAIVRAARDLGVVAALVIASVVSSLLFGLSHFAHSPPFDQLSTVLFLSIVGLATSVFYFVTRDATGTIVFHSFLGTHGVLQALANADSLAALQGPHPELVLTGLAAVAGLAIGYRVLRGAGPS